MQIDEDDQRIDDQRHQQHSADQQKQQAAILGEDRQAVVRHIGENQTHDAERCKVDDPAHDGGDRVRSVGHKVLRRIAAQALHRQAEQAGPHQDADVVAVHDRRHRVGNNVGQQCVHDVTQTLRHNVRCGGLGQNQRLREQLAGHHAQRRGHKGRQHIQPDNGAEAAVQLG